MLFAALLPAALLFAQTGEELYLAQCSICHGQNGEGGRGSPLTRTRLRHAPNDGALFNVIRRGIPDTGMPGNPLDEEEIKLVAAHVRKLGRAPAGPPPPGDARHGEQVYNGKGACAACHTIGGRGGAAGPDLSAIGERRNAAHLRESVVHPKAEISPGYFRIRATGASGTVTGVRVNEDSFSIQIRDAAGRVHSLWKSTLRSLDKDLGESMMPSYQDRLTPAELDDLAAFLSARREVQ